MQSCLLSIPCHCFFDHGNSLGWSLVLDPFVDGRFFASADLTDRLLLRRDYVGSVWGCDMVTS